MSQSVTTSVQDYIGGKQGARRAASIFKLHTKQASIPGGSTVVLFSDVRTHDVQLSIITYSRLRCSRARRGEISEVAASRWLIVSRIDRHMSYIFWPRKRFLRTEKESRGTSSESSRPKRLTRLLPHCQQVRGHSKSTIRAVLLVKYHYAVGNSDRLLSKQFFLLLICCSRVHFDIKTAFRGNYFLMMGLPSI